MLSDLEDLSFENMIRGLGHLKVTTNRFCKKYINVIYCYTVMDMWIFDW